MLVINNDEELDKFKKVEGNQFIYEFDQDVVINFKQNLFAKYEKIKEERFNKCKTDNERILMALDESYRPHIIYRGKNITFNQDIYSIDQLELNGNLICNAYIEGDYFRVEGDIKAKNINCENLVCGNLNADDAFVGLLSCEGDVNCNTLTVENIDTVKKLNAKVFNFKKTTLYNVSAVGKNSEKNNSKTEKISSIRSLLPHKT